MTVLSVAEAKRHLGLQDASVDAAVEAVIVAAEAAITARCGPLEPTTYTETLTGTGGTLTVRSPLLSVTTVNGNALTNALTPSMLAAGVIPGTHRGDVAVVYVAGRTTVPADLLMGIKELVAHLWNTTQRSAADRRGRQDATQQALTGTSYLFPYRVEQWIAPYVLAGIG